MTLADDRCWHFCDVHGCPLCGRFRGRPLAEQHDVGIANDIAAQRRHQVREPAIAQILAPVTQIVWLEHAVVIDAILDAATDMVAVNCEHRLNVAIA